MNIKKYIPLAILSSAVGFVVGLAIGETIIYIVQNT